MKIDLLQKFSTAIFLRKSQKVLCNNKASFTWYVFAAQIRAGLERSKKKKKNPLAVMLGAA